MKSAVVACKVLRYPGPILALRGEREAQEMYPAEAIAKAAEGRSRLEVIAGGDHFYNGVEEVFTSAVRAWFEAAVAPGSQAR